MTGHRLSEYVRAVGARRMPPGWDDSVITQVTYDSREVVPGSLFICKGVHFDPAYLCEAIQKGAVAYISEKAYPDMDVPALIVDDIRDAIATAGTLFYDQDWSSLTLIGVTGTKGKSTTTLFIHEILAAWARAAGKPVPGILSSIRYEDGVCDEASTRTTPETLDLYRHLHNAAASHLGYMCVEVSSQALKYKRVANLNFEIGCFLNISEDHISPHEHPDYEDYLKSKLKLFSQSRIGVVNMRTQDLDRVLRAASGCEKVLTFAVNQADNEVKADVAGYGITTIASGQQFSVDIFGEEHDFTTTMQGTFNVENAVAAITVATCLGVPVEYVREGLAAAYVPGRMEVFHLNRGTTVVVDYAHQKLSIQTILDWAKDNHPHAPITMVCGAVGEKAWNRRAELGVLAGENADEIYLTEQDPGDAGVEEICHDIDQHVQDSGHKPAHIVPDRPDAIAQAIQHAPDDGLVLVLGKGAEQFQYRSAGPVPVRSDVDTVRGIVENQG